MLQAASPLRSLLAGWALIGEQLGGGGGGRGEWYSNRPWGNPGSTNVCCDPVTLPLMMWLRCEGSRRRTCSLSEGPRAAVVINTISILLQLHTEFNHGCASSETCVLPAKARVGLCRAPWHVHNGTCTWITTTGKHHLDCVEKEKSNVLISAGTCSNYNIQVNYSLVFKICWTLSKHISFKNMLNSNLVIFSVVVVIIAMVYVHM